MATRFYESDKQFQQEAIAFVSVAFYESACVLISDGNIAEAEETALSELINICRSKSFDSGTKNAVATYFNLVQEENDHMRQAFRKNR